MYTYKEVYEATKEYFSGDELLTDIWVNKYTLKDKKGNYYELTPESRINLIVDELVRIESNYGEIDKSEFRQRVFNLIRDFKYFIPGGSIIYGLGNKQFLSSLGNCFVIGNKTDSYGSICKIDEEQVQLMKRRGGVGHDLSHLRPKGVPVNGCANTSTGSVSFASRYSHSTREVAQDGRRGALMLTHHINHPDVVDFIKLKDDTSKVTGANISVKVTDEFMNNVLSNGEHRFKFPINSEKEHSKINAKDLFDKLIHQAWKNGEPGVLFWDKIIKESPADCYKGFETESTNPCFPGDTLIAVADGRKEVSIKQLTDEGEPVPVYTIDSEGKLCIREMSLFRKTGRDEIYEVLFDNGQIQECTGNHNFITRKRGKIQAKDLLKGDSVPTITRNTEGRNFIGYKEGFVLESRLIYEYYHGEIPGGCEIHHVNKISNDDRIENLQCLTIKEHHKLHYPYYMLGDSNPMRRFPEKNPFNNPIFQKQIREQYHTGKTRGQTTKNLIQEKVREKYLKREQLLDVYNELKVELGRKPNYDEWKSESLLKGLDPSFKSSKYASNKFRDFADVEERASLINHRVISVHNTERVDDVYNGTVEGTHTYFVRSPRSEKQSYVLVANCGELPLSPYDSCRLGHINLYAYIENPYTINAKFNKEKFEQDIVLIQRLMDNVIDLEKEKINDIIFQVENSYDDEDSRRNELQLWVKIKEALLSGRRTGLGMLGEADAVAALGYTYASKEANEFIINAHKILALKSYESSILLAKERGAFPIWNIEKEKNNPFINRVLSELNRDWRSEKGEDNPLIWIYEEYGRRNISNLTVAPTGTTAQLVGRQGVSSGIEPVFEVFYKRRRKINPNDKNSKVDFTDEVGDKWTEYYVIHPGFKRWYEINDNSKPLEDCSEEELNELIKKSPYHRATANEIDVISKVKLQGEVQKWVDHSISVTHNLPKETTEEQVSEFFIESWKSGCKGMTVYRDGSRAGVLVKNKIEDDIFTYVDAKPRPEILNCEVHRLQSRGQYFFVLIGILSGNPYEIFVVEEKQFPTYLRIASSQVLRGQIVKRKSTLYDLITTRPDNNEPVLIKDIVSLMPSDDNRTDTKRFSLELRHRISPKEIVETIEKSCGDITAFEKAIARVLKKYIKEGEMSGLICSSCGSRNMTYSGGCLRCKDCGESKCS